MTKVSNPKINITKAPASQIISNAPQRVLIVGQQTGSVYTSGQLVENIENANVEITNVGLGSQIGAMMAGYKAINQETALDIIPLDDNGSAVDATGTVAFSGTATEDGTFIVYAGSRTNNKYTIAVTSGDSATAIGDALEAAVTADTVAVVAASNTTGTVTMTANNGGTYGNGIGLESQGIVAGITVTVTGMASGATDPVLTGLFDVVGQTRYQTVIFPGNFDESVLTGFLDPRFNASNQILDGVGVISKTDTLGNLNTFLGTLNSQSLIVQVNEIVSDTLYKGSALFELDDVIAAEFGAIRSLRLTDGANISQFVIATNLDLIGGTQAASLPYFNTPFFNLPIIDTGKGFTQTEIDSLNDSGGFVLGNNTTRTNIIADEVFTTYKTDVAGNPDLTYQFLNSVDTFSNIAEFFFNNLRADYAQFRLTDGEVTSGYNIANEGTIRSSFIDYYQTLSGPGFLLTRSGRENVKFFAEKLTFTLDLLEGKVTSIAEVPLVAQLRQMDIILKAVFNI